MGLDKYEQKRDFRRTPEPRASRRPKAPGAGLQFVVQQHAARRLHFDFRLELDGVLKSWAVPKGPSLVPGERRMAVETEDHPLEYATFEGVIPKGEYGGGTVVVWDRGFWQPIGDPHAGLEAGKLDLTLAGQKLRGRWHLVRLRPRPNDRGQTSWLLMKSRDAEARQGPEGEITASAPESVLTGRTLPEVARDADRVWTSEGGEEHAPAIGPPGDAASVPGARRGALPRKLEPQLATLVDAPPEGDEWLHEIKLDGYRMMARLEQGAARLSTRAGHDWTDRLPALARAVAELPAETAVLDGEVVVLDAHGRSRFQALQRALRERRPDVRLYLFDLLYLDGVDLCDAPLVLRKEVLRQLLSRAPARSILRYADHVRGRGPAFLSEACRSGVEGIVSKRAGSPYRAGRTRAWLKIKCGKRQEFVVVGFTDPGGSRVGFGALLLGVHDETGALRFAGRVGTGFSGELLGRLQKQLAALEQPKPPVAAPPPGWRRMHWVSPRLVAEVSFAEWTEDGIIRHPSFLGLREDKPAADVRVERPEQLAHTERPAKALHRNEVAGVRLSSPGRVYFPDVGVTKSELAVYYETMAERILPGLSYRPLTLLRCPEGRQGNCFYQKHASESVPERIPRVSVRPDEAPYMMVTDLASLIGLVQIGVLEFHVWGARADRLDRPDLLIFDLDPDESVAWRRVATTARVLRALLEELGLTAFVRATGGKGLHVVSPLVRRSSWDEVKGFAHALARQLVREAPTELTAKMAKSSRTGKIYLDYLRNDPDSTAIASYSARARPGAPVALPLAWDELDAREGPPRVSIRDAPARLQLADPWKTFEAQRRPLTRDALRRVGAAT